MNRDTAQRVGIGLFGLIVFVLFAGGESSTPHDFFALGLLVIGAAMIQAFTGKILTDRNNGPIERDKSPSSFWLSIVSLLAAGAGCVVWATPHLDRVWSLPHFFKPEVKQ